jgi:hypothetical protein
LIANRWEILLRIQKIRAVDIRFSILVLLSVMIAAADHEIRTVVTMGASAGPGWLVELLLTSSDE